MAAKYECILLLVSVIGLLQFHTPFARRTAERAVLGVEREPVDEVVDEENALASPAQGDFETINAIADNLRSHLEGQEEQVSHVDELVEGDSLEHDERDNLELLPVLEDEPTLEQDANAELSQKVLPAIEDGVESQHEELSADVLPTVEASPRDLDESSMGEQSVGAQSTLEEDVLDSGAASQNGNLSVDELPIVQSSPKDLDESSMGEQSVAAQSTLDESEFAEVDPGSPSKSEPSDVSSVDEGELEDLASISSKEELDSVSTLDEGVPSDMGSIVDNGSTSDVDLEDELDSQSVEEVDHQSTPVSIGAGDHELVSAQDDEVVSAQDDEVVSAQDHELVSAEVPPSVLILGFPRELVNGTDRQIFNGMYLMRSKQCLGGRETYWWNISSDEEAEKAGPDTPVIYHCANDTKYGNIDRWSITIKSLIPTIQEGRCKGFAFFKAGDISTANTSHIEKVFIGGVGGTKSRWVTEKDEEWVNDITVKFDKSGFEGDITCSA